MSRMDPNSNDSEPLENPTAPLQDLEHWESRVVDLRTNQLGLIRVSAEKWRSGILTLVTVAAGAALLGKPSMQLSSWVGVTGLIAWISGALLLVSALLATMLASFGLPGKAIALFPESVADWERKQARNSRIYLIAAAICVSLGVFALLTATVLSYATPS